MRGEKIRCTKAGYQSLGTADPIRRVLMSWKWVVLKGTRVHVKSQSQPGSCDSAGRGVVQTPGVAIGGSGRVEYPEI
jgi:hypothetical protein